MDYEWNEKKSEANRKIRGFGFDIMEDFDWDFALGPEIQHVEGEEREMWIGPIGDHIYAVVLTERECAFRVVSLRRAQNSEIGLWRKEFLNV